MNATIIKATTIKAKMNRIFLAALSCCFFVTPFLASQVTPSTIYAESFRQGSTRVTEESFEAKLDPRNAKYRERIKDLHGEDRYELFITPQGPEGDSQITSWKVKLVDLRHPIYNNILEASQNASSEAANNLWWLNPSQSAPVPVKAHRIVKVDSFYVVLKVTAFHFTPLDSPYLDSMTVQVKFTNTDPRKPSP